MTELLTAAQMRAIEQAAIESGQVTGLELMERAGRGVVEAVFEEWPELVAGSHRAVVLCGPGNNGGDGFVVARLLKEWGWEVEVFLCGDPAKLPCDARTNYERWRRLGGVVPLEEAAVMAAFSEDAIVFDALFGTGLTRPLDGEAFAVQRRIAGLKGPVEFGRLVAVDCPSGLCLDSGRVISRGAGAAGLYVPPAQLTVTFQSRKLGHVLADGPAYCGKCRVVDIGVADVLRLAVEGRLDGGIDPMKRNEFVHEAVAPVAAPSAYATPLGPSVCLSKLVSGHKFNHGHVVVVSGPHGQGGAARLAARAALRVGAGVVTVAVPPDAVAEHAARLDAVMVRPVEGADDLTELCSDERLRALCIGPGLGLDERAVHLLEAALELERPVVLDADALSLIAKHKALRAKLHMGCVLTPHMGEFARLWPKIDKKRRAVAKVGPAYSRVDAVREAAVDCGAQVLLKGPDTVSAHKMGGCRVNVAQYDRAAPWLATAGSGDVLAGLIAGLLGRNVPPPEAASTGAWLHAECARSFGPGLIAEDLPDELPQVFRDLGL